MGEMGVEASVACMIFKLCYFQLDREEGEIVLGLGAGFGCLNGCQLPMTIEGTVGGSLIAGSE